jgi:hypothetical protein
VKAVHRAAAIDLLERRLVAPPEQQADLAARAFALLREMTEPAPDQRDVRAAVSALTEALRPFTLDTCTTALKRGHTALRQLCPELGTHLELV